MRRSRRLFTLLKALEMAIAFFTPSRSNELLSIAQGKARRSGLAKAQAAANFREKTVKGMSPYEIYMEALELGVNPPCLHCGNSETRSHGNTKVQKYGAKAGTKRFLCVGGCGNTFSRKTAVELTIHRPTCSNCGIEQKKIKNGTPVRANGEVVQSWRCSNCGDTTMLPILDLEALKKVL